MSLPPPLVPASRALPEITLKAFVLGIALSILLGAANAYIGLLVGLTVSASIPAAAVSMGLLRLFKRSNILENNMVQTSASAGEAMVAGMIFTIPALVMMQAWNSYEYFPSVLIAFIGGVLGVAFTVPLRRALIIEAQLKFPEGVVTAEVLKTGGVETGGERQSPSGQLTTDTQRKKDFSNLLQAAGVSALFKLCGSGLGLLAGSVSATRAWFGGSFLFTGNIALSPALVGVGYLVGLNIALLIFAGGALGTLIGVPLNWLLNGEALRELTGIVSTLPASEFSSDQWRAIASEAWSQNRRIGVGAMLVGGIWSLMALYKPLVDGVKASIAAYQAARSGSQSTILRTELDTPIHFVALTVAVAAIPLFFVFYSVLNEFDHAVALAAFMTLLMLLFGFVFASVAGYMAGLIGNSNNPVSGVTIATVIISALILLQLIGNEGIAATVGPIAIIYLAALVCTGAALAGDNLQDLKCGHLVGATPWKQQLFQIIGVTSAALIIPLVLQVLDSGYGIGRPADGNTSGTYLSAPQASLMKDLASSVFGAGLQWTFIFIGCALAVLLIVADEIQKRRGSHFRIPVLAVAVGIYLPLGLSVPVLIGGLLSHALKQKYLNTNEETQSQKGNSGLLVASGLITGEALMGVGIAIFAAFIMPLPSSLPFAGILGLIALAGVIYYQYKKPQT